MRPSELIQSSFARTHIKHFENLHKFTKYCNSYSLWVILFSAVFCCSAQAPPKYLPIGINGVSTESARMAIALPEGFKPQAPSIKSMIFPFVTPTTSSSPSGGWRPIVGIVTTPPPLAPPPLTVLEDRAYTTSPAENEAPIPGLLLESIVYGTWKPEPPVSPNEIHATTRRNSVSLTVRNSARKPYTTSLEQLGSQHPIPNLHTDEVDLIQKNVRRRITTTPKCIMENVSEPNLVDMAKQINNSLDDVTSYHTQKPKILVSSQNTEKISTFTAVGEEASDLETNTETTELDISKVWPTDFTATLEGNNNKLNSTQKFNYSFIGDSSDPPPAMNDLNVPSSLLPQISLNITKVGVPYEKQSSAEEPNLCVPITVLEQLSQAEVIEVERVYCFPLPPTHTGTPRPKNVATENMENFTEYEAVNGANGLCWDCAHISSSSLIILFYQKLKYS